VSETASEKRQNLPQISVKAKEKMLSAGKIGVEGVMRSLPGYDKHIELDPTTLIPQTTKSAMPTFMGISYAILPYNPSPVPTGRDTLSPGERATPLLRLFALCPGVCVKTGGYVL
jgi:hypothetical protein